jgi:hypothetical protein
LHIRVVSSRILTVVPGVWGRFDIHPGWWDDNARRGHIQVPVWVPVRPDRHHNFWPDEGMAPVPAAVPATVSGRAAAKAMAPLRTAVPAMVSGRAAAKAMAPLLAPLGVSWGRAHHEQPHQEPYQHQPLLSRARGPVSVTHYTPLSRHPIYRPGQIPSAATSCARPPPTEADLLVCAHCTQENPSSATAAYSAIAPLVPDRGPAVDSEGSMFYIPL